jgi:putative ABC transport system permease protein
MNWLLARLFGRLPIGWLQLTHSRGRMAAALAGVAFANLLVFVQLGVLGALTGTVGLSYSPFKADIIISASDANTLTDGSPLSRRTLWRTLVDPAIEAAAPLHIGRLDWQREDGSIASLTVYGLPVEASAFAGELLRSRLAELSVPGVALIDSLTRGADAEALASISPETPLVFEANGRTIRAIDSFALGGGFTGDGSIIVSDQSFLGLFPNRIAGTPSHILLNTVPEADTEGAIARITALLSNEPVQVRSLDTMISNDVTYQTTQRPVGVILGFGVFMGILVGIIIVYQVLSTDVADHMKEYATFKAMGYPHRFFLGIVFEEALVLGVLGFLPGIALTMIIYNAMAGATGLPVEMDAVRALAVFFGTIAACSLSGALATRRLRAADPAELF